MPPENDRAAGWLIRPADQRLSDRINCLAAALGAGKSGADEKFSTLTLSIAIFSGLRGIYKRRKIEPAFEPLEPTCFFPAARKTPRPVESAFLKIAEIASKVSPK